MSQAPIVSRPASLSSPLSNHASLSSSFSFARISRLSSALSLAVLRDIGLDHGGNLPRPQRGSKHAFGRETVRPPLLRPSLISSLHIASINARDAGYVQ